MKKSGLRLRAFANARLLAAIGVAILIAIFVTATAVMKSRSGQREINRAPVSPQISLKNTGGSSNATFVSPQEPKSPQPDVVQMVGPVSQDQDLRDLPYIPPTAREEVEVPLRRHPFQPGAAPGKSDPLRAVKELLLPVSMPGTTLSFGGIDSVVSGCGCLPPDTDGDVGPNHYVQSVNSSIRVHDKSGNVLAGPVTYNSFFSALGASTPCGNNVNDGDGIVFYDHIADRWVVSDFAFSAFPGAGPFYQCIGVSKTSDPVSGGWWLYAQQVDPANTNFIGDYPKFGLWPDAYYLSVNLFSGADSSFQGVRVFALNRSAMIGGGAASTIAFTILPANLGDQYSLLPATFRTGSAPPAAQPEWFMDINSSAVAGTVETQVFVRRFHVDFVTPGLSTFGVGGTHTPDGTITVTGFVDAFTSTTGNIAPNGTATATQFLDTLGDKLMYPLIYQKLGAVESVYSSHTVNNNQGGTGPTAIRWYQFNVTGNTIPATPTQQQTFNNGADGLFRWMPSINVDTQGNMAIGYSASSTTVDPGIRYAGRLVGDAANTLAQGEAVMTPGTGHQTDTSGRWGDYSAMFVDPTDTCTFWHTNEYYSATSAAGWNTRVGTFKFAGCTGTPLPTPTPTATPTPTPSPTPPVSAGPVTVTATAATLGPTDYATVKAAFDAINLGTHKGTINIFILGNTVEAAAAVLNASGGSSSYTSIRMQPSGARTVTGALATPLIDFNGADFVTVDGMNSGGNSLTISNTNSGAVATTSTIRFINGATNNVITNATILGSFSGTIATTGGNIYFATDASTTNGNDNNTISFCNIGPAGANLPSKAIHSTGTTTTQALRNSGNVIDSNNIFDFFRDVATSGIHILAGNDLWTISNNRFYQTAPRVFTTAASRYAAITLNPGATGSFTVTGNTIGFGAANGTGTTTLSGSSNEFRGIDAPSVSTTTTTSIQGNIISGINQTSSRASTTLSLSCFIGIMMGTTAGTFNVGTVTGNTIGSLDASSTIVINETSTTASTAPALGIYDFSLSSNNISNNKMGSITINSGGSGTTVGFMGILVNTATTLFEAVNNNIIGGTAAGSITDNIVGSYAMYGIQVVSANLSATGNTVRNMVGNSNGAGLIVSSGIIVSGSTGANTISQNVIHSLSNASGAGSNSIYAISASLPAAGNIVERNFIHSLSMTSSVTTGQLVGIISSNAASTATYKNNMVRLGLDASGSSVTLGLFLAGLWDNAGTNNFYFNSVYIGGSGVVSSSMNFAFFSQVVTNVRSYRDNIFWNARSNASGAGKNYAISVAGTAPNPAGLTSNFNDLFATGTGGFVGLFNSVDQTTLANWKTATGQDASSISSDPKFIAPTGTATTVNLHILGTSPCINAGTPIAGVANDFDGDPRDATPDIGADQVVGPSATNASIGGTISDSDGVPVSGVTINLSGTDSREAITDSSGKYSFDSVETNGFYTVTPSRANYTFSPANRSFSLLGVQTEASFTATANRGRLNPLDTTGFFVRQHYLDFLGREPDPPGFAGWVSTLNNCAAGDASCDRVHVSEMFYRSQEFQERGYFAYRFYTTAFGRKPDYGEFVSDLARVSGFLTDDQLEGAKSVFIDDFMARPAFARQYDSLSDTAFVDTLLRTAEVDLSNRQALIDALRTRRLGRAQVLRQIAESSEVYQKYYNQAFVVMEYFGYLHRDPDALYTNWIEVLNQGGDPRRMVDGFVNSAEYRNRFVP